jgi:AmiR/NasT family two-component response regulator
LSAALTSRIIIEQAKGVISERAGVDVAEAFSRLRAYARSGNRRLTEVAQAAVDGSLDSAAWS